MSYLRSSLPTKINIYQIKRKFCFTYIAFIIAGTFTFFQINPLKSQINISKIEAATAHLCVLPAETGHELAVFGKTSADVRSIILRALLGAGVDVDGEISTEAWAGVQRPLQQHQHPDNVNARDCVRDLFPQLVELVNDAEVQPNNRAADEGEVDVECNVLQPEFGSFGPVTADTCFTNPSASAFGSISIIYNDRVVFKNATGREFTCNPGDRCSFGWEDAPVFSVISINGSSSRVFLTSVE